MKRKTKKKTSNESKLNDEYVDGLSSVRIKFLEKNSFRRKFLISSIYGIVHHTDKIKFY